ncbi:MAG: 50S ribosomal protein L15 [Candidatus Amesbacteria bacterium GW2011_GWA2_42_12]|uniref:Large ribosomal subunit protein uL15 n=1 Tax=Candidatus Amesbacteria bacterium GW2011_GWA2_42_12 TaxID=1618356 RepID=A0A0G0Y995_9BACT|nr:MAG: 50S ribosomal protein L15 [Candidatus Amesbacteria bacterium GW2011_GWA2_42_12]
MNLSELPKLVSRSAKRVGRGMGSGKGSHTSGRGTKGQKAREDVKITMEGTKFKKGLIKRLPFLRGKSLFKPTKNKPVAVSLSRLLDWAEATPVTIENLVKKGMVASDTPLVKLVGNAKITKALKVKVLVSTGAKKIIEKAGGSIESQV